MKQFLAIFTAAFFLVSCQNQSSSAWQTLKFIQDKPFLTHINLGDTAHGHGDGMAYESILKDTTGTVVGEVLGWMVTVDIVDGDSANTVHMIDRIGTMIIKFGDGDKIIVPGSSIYNKGEQVMKKGIPQINAVVGGTGKYKGVRGEVAITRNENGTYTHILDIKMGD
jgi:hypothetical protein